MNTLGQSVPGPRRFARDAAVAAGIAALTFVLAQAEGLTWSGRITVGLVTFTCILVTLHILRRGTKSANDEAAVTKTTAGALATAAIIEDQRQSRREAKEFSDLLRAKNEEVGVLVGRLTTMERIESNWIEAREKAQNAAEQARALAEQATAREEQLRTTLNGVEVAVSNALRSPSLGLLNSPESDATKALRLSKALEEIGRMIGVRRHTFDFGQGLGRSFAEGLGAAQLQHFAKLMTSSLADQLSRGPANLKRIGGPPPSAPRTDAPPSQQGES